MTRTAPRPPTADRLVRTPRTILGPYFTLGMPLRSAVVPDDVGALAGAVGWQVVRRRATNPAAVLRWLVPLVVALSLIPDVLVGMSLGWTGGIALALMHLAMAAVAVAAYRRFLPLAH